MAAIAVGSCLASVSKKGPSSAGTPGGSGMPLVESTPLAGSVAPSSVVLLAASTGEGDGLRQLVVLGDGDDILLVIDVRQLEVGGLEVEGVGDALGEGVPRERGRSGEAANFRAEVQLDDEGLRLL